MSSLKTLAQKAKFRLRAISQDDVNEEKVQKEVCLSARVQYAIIASKKKVEDDPIYNKVRKILSRDEDTLSPLAELIEDEGFCNLPSSQQEKLLFNLSKRYTQIKDHVASQLKEAM